MELVRGVLLRWPLLVVAIFALATLVIAARPERAEADAGGHTNMIFQLQVNQGTLGTVCNTVPGQDECSVPVGGMFQVRFLMQKGADVQWEYVRFSLDYAGVASKDNPELYAPDVCSEPANVSIDAQPGSLAFDCTLSSPSNVTVGAFADFNCTATPSLANEIRLFVGTGDGDSYIVDEFGERHSEAAEVRSMFIDCVEPQRADMHLEIEGGDALCDLPDEPTECDVPVGGSFTFAVATDDPPSSGYDFVGTEVLYAGLRYNPAPDDPSSSPFPDEGANAEMVWPFGPGGMQGIGALREPFPPSGEEGYVRHGRSGGEPNYAGNLLELTMTCEQAGTFPVTVTSERYPDRPKGSLFIFSDVNTVKILLNSEDTVQIHCGGSQAVGGNSTGPGVRGLPLETGGGGHARSLLFAIAGVSFVTVALTAPWYTRRRWLR